MTINSLEELEKKVEENPNSAENWLLLIEAQLSAGIDMKEIGNTFIRAIKAIPSDNDIYYCAIQALEGFDLEDIIKEIEVIRKRELDKPRGFV
jgi:hypothetical protein